MVELTNDAQLNGARIINIDGYILDTETKCINHIDQYIDFYGCFDIHIIESYQSDGSLCHESKYWEHCFLVNEGNPIIFSSLETALSEMDKILDKSGERRAKLLEMLSDFFANNSYEEFEHLIKEASDDALVPISKYQLYCSKVEHKELELHKSKTLNLPHVSVPLSEIKYVVKEGHEDIRLCIKREREPIILSRKSIEGKAICNYYNIND